MAISKKDVQWTNSSQANLSSADHSNEEEVRTYNVREFGAGRSDDFSTLTTSSDRAFTLEDGTTSLNGEGALIDTFFSNIESVRTDAPGDHFIFSFIGTGLDLHIANNAISRSQDIRIDGVSIGSLNPSTLDGVKIQKIVSGLPYGIHSMEIINNTGGVDGFGIFDFIVYGPKASILPSGAIKLFDYFLMADYDASTAVGTTEADSVEVPEGALYKASIVEPIYEGSSWGIFNVINIPSGRLLTTVTNGDKVRYTFFGDSVSIFNRANAAGDDPVFTIRIDGVLTAGATNLVNLIDSTGGTYTVSAGIREPVRATFTGLSYGLHTITLERTGGTGSMQTIGFYIGTRIHSPKENIAGNLQNTLPVGSQYVGDRRNFSPIGDENDLPNWFQAVGVTNTPTTTVTQPLFVPIADMHGVLKTNGKPIEITFIGTMGNSVDGNAAYIALFIDGVQVGPAVSTDTKGGANTDHEMSMSQIVPVAAGNHFIQIKFARGSAGTARAFNIQRILTAKELK